MVSRPPRPRDWSGTRQWALSLAAVAVIEVALFSPEVSNRWWLMAPLWLALGHVLHGHLIAFHESAHGYLIPVRKLNDMAGAISGLFSFMSLTLYGVTHSTHHGGLGSQTDEELWPFVAPAVPRSKRRVAAVFELGMGLCYTPYLFLRSYFRRGTRIRNKTVRRRIALELCGIAAFWCGVIAFTAAYDLGKELIIAYLVPAWIAGNLQSLRKYVEHMGLFGNTAVTLTRSIDDPTITGRLLSLSLFNEPFHGAHHQQARLAQHELPAAARTTGFYEGQPLVFQTYTAAVTHMLGHLRDPRIGAHWLS
jgi:fatty acid desaturase